jgi:carbamoyltransferase
LKKFLIGIHTGKHDCNLSIFDGEIFKYYKHERRVQIKHAVFEINIKNNIIDYKDFLINVLKFIEIEKNQIEAIALSSSFWFQDMKNQQHYLTNEFQDICNNVYFVDHHYAHFLSHGNTDNGWVYDGYGNDLKYSSIYKQNKLQSYLKSPEDGYSLGVCLEEFADVMYKDRWKAGVVMAYDALGTLNQQYFNKYKDYDLTKSAIYQSWPNFSMSHGKQIINTDVDYDYVKTIHEITKNNHLNYLKEFFKKEDSFVFTGGISQSIILNTHLKKNFPNIEITPHGYDGGISLGLIEFLCTQKSWNKPNLKDFPFIQSDEHPGFPKKGTIIKSAEMLAKGKIILWYQGYGEIGPRALGNRSILANPSILNIKEQINTKVKKRAWYRPYGASVIEEEYKNYFDLEWISPYMLYQANVKDQEEFKSITHFDGTCRIQTVDSGHFVFYELLEEFKKLTGFPVLLNTSLNLPGKPIAGSINHALEIFKNSQADAIVYGDSILERQ